MLIVSVSIYIHISVSAPTPAARVRFHPLFFFWWLLVPCALYTRYAGPCPTSLLISKRAHAPLSLSLSLTHTHTHTHGPDKYILVNHKVYVSQSICITKYMYHKVYVYTRVPAYIHACLVIGILTTTQA